MHKWDSVNNITVIEMVGINQRINIAI